jgi:hypothetical protein
MESLYSHEKIVDDFQEEGKQTIIQHGMIEDMVEEMEPEQNEEVLMCAPPSDEAIQEPFSLVQQKEDEVSCVPSQSANDTLFLDSENEGEKKALNEVDGPCCAIKDKEAVHEDETMTHDENIEVLKVPAQQKIVSYPPLLVFYALPYDEEEEEDEFSDVSNPPCYDIDSDTVDNIDEFIHIGRCRWDIVDYDLDPIYDTESHFQLLPLQLSQQITSNQWQQGDEIFTQTFQKTKDDLVPYSPDDFQSYLETLMSTLLSTWTLFMKMIANHHCAQILIQARTSFAYRRFLMTFCSSHLLLLYHVFPLKV